MNWQQDGYIYESNMQLDKIYPEPAPQTSFYDQNSNTAIPQTSSPARPRRHQPQIPRKRSLERQKGFEQYEDSSNTPSTLNRTPLIPPDHQVAAPFPKKLPQISKASNKSSIFLKVD